MWGNRCPAFADALFFASSDNSSCLAKSLRLVTLFLPFSILGLLHGGARATASTRPTGCFHSGAGQRLQLPDDHGTALPPPRPQVGITIVQILSEFFPMVAHMFAQPVSTKRFRRPRGSCETTCQCSHSSGSRPSGWDNHSGYSRT
jgi:hypothetical protein